MTMTPASTQDRIDAPPADFAAVRAPSSPPDPMIEPSEMNISALNPTVRRRPVPVVSAGPSAVVDMGLQGRDGGSTADASEGVGAFDARMVRTSGPPRYPDIPGGTGSMSLRGG